MKTIDIILILLGSLLLVSPFLSIVFLVIDEKNTNSFLPVLFGLTVLGSMCLGILLIYLAFL